MIRVCPERDARCPHGVACPYTDTRYRCKPGWNTDEDSRFPVTERAKLWPTKADLDNRPLSRFNGGPFIKWLQRLFRRKESDRACNET